MGWQEVYTDMQKSVGPTANDGKELWGKLQHEAGRIGWLMQDVLMNRDFNEVMSSSDRISTSLMFDYAVDSTFHNPGVPRPRNIPQFLTTSTIEYAFQDQPQVTLDQQIILNGGQGVSERKTQFVNMIIASKVRAMSSMISLAEDASFVKPNAGSMENVVHPTVRVPMSIWSIVNESVGYSATNTQAAQTAALGVNNVNHDGLYRDAAGAALVSAGYTSVAGVAGTEARWRNQIFEFRHASTARETASGDTMFDGQSLIKAMIDGFLRTRFVQATSDPKEFMSDDVSKQRILSGPRGINLWIRITSALGGMMRMRPYPDVYGTPMVMVPNIETSQVFPNGALTGTVGCMDGAALGGTAADSACWGPRFLLWNTPKAHPVWHRERMFRKITEYKVQGAEEVNAEVYHSWWNWKLESRQRLAIVRGNMSAATSLGV